MNRRQITLPDGRYLIFYTFEDEPAPQSSQHAAAAEKEAGREEKREPKPEPQAVEERSV